MTGTEAFPEGYGGGVYFNYQPNGESKWIFLGRITNQKPSAIYKLGKLKIEENHLLSHPFGNVDLKQETNSNNLNNALIGISVEPISMLSAESTSDTQPSTLASFVEYTQKMLENFYNYSSSFVLTLPDGQQYVPLVSLQNWFNNFKRRLELNPQFWKNL